MNSPEAVYVGKHRRLHGVTVTDNRWRCICGVRAQSASPEAAQRAGLRHTTLYGGEVEFIFAVDSRGRAVA